MDGVLILCLKEIYTEMKLKQAIIIRKAKYIERKGVPGSFTYKYKEPETKKEKKEDKPLAKKAKSFYKEMREKYGGSWVGEGDLRTKVSLVAFLVTAGKAKVVKANGHVKVMFSKAEKLTKAKYTKRWKGKDGKWNYEYGKPSKKYVIDPSGIAESFNSAQKQMETRKQSYISKLQKIPVGASFKGKGHSWTLTELGGDRMWVRDDNKTGYADGSLLVEFGQKTVDNLLSQYKTQKKRHEFDAEKEGWKNMKGAEKKAISISENNPTKYITMTADFHIVGITEHSNLPTSAYAPSDFKRGYWKNGKHFDWSEKRKTKAATVGFGVSD